MGQTPGPPDPARIGAADNAIHVRSVAIETSADGPAIAIASNGALVPAITRLDGPPRLVIDLAGAVNSVPRSRMAGVNGEIKSIRVSQYQQNPPLTRVVVDLSEPRDYAWETVQNKLVVHLRRPDETPNASDKPPGFTTGVEPAVTYASGGPGNLMSEVAQDVSGPSTVTAGEQTTVLNLARGGQIKVCPGTTISANSSPDKRDVMIGMSTGALEAHYTSTDSADSVLTPDFRILLAGPGEFHVAISADSLGNTCVRSLPGNNASAVVSELIGEGTYQVKAKEEVVFHKGQLSKAGHDVPIDCGCPAAQVPILRTEAAPSAIPPQTVPGGEESSGGGQELPGAQAASAGTAIRMAATPADAVAKRNEIHMQVDAPLVFRGTDPLPPTMEEAKNLPAISSMRQPLPEIPLAPPTAESTQRPAKPRTGFLGRVKHFFSSVFG